MRRSERRKKGRRKKRNLRRPGSWRQPQCDHGSCKQRKPEEERKRKKQKE